MDLQGANILITGGTGFLGRNLVPTLIQEGAHVIILTRHPESAQEPKGAEFVVWDGRTTQGWGQRMDQVDIVVNLAGENLGNYPWSDERIQRIRSSRVNAGQALVQAIQAASHRPSVFLQASGIGYYGVLDDEEKTEDSLPGIDLLARICVDWENSSKDVENFGVRRVITRSAMVLDAREGVLPKIALPFNLFIGGPLGGGKQWVPWIHVQDELAAMRFLIDRETASGPFNLIAPIPVRNNQFGRVLAGVLHRPYWIPAPAFLLKLVLNRMATLVLDGQRAFPERLKQAGYHFLYPDLQEALINVYQNS